MPTSVAPSAYAICHGPARLSRAFKSRPSPSSAASDLRQTHQEHVLEQVSDHERSHDGNQRRSKQAPQARLFVLEVFPRGERFNSMRGELAQLNQALRARQAELGCQTLAIGDRWVQRDGSISSVDMPDHLHLSAAAYGQWAEALEPTLRAALR